MGNTKTELLAEDLDTCAAALHRIAEALREGRMTPEQVNSPRNRGRAVILRRTIVKCAAALAELGLTV